uniref:Uncharacterized protein n=1 Tax=Lepeophtheirus salmonis TaxID=72036 RepID=A0A0K2U0Z1_LEPSM
MTDSWFLSFLRFLHSYLNDFNGLFIFSNSHNLLSEECFPIISAVFLSFLGILGIRPSFTMLNDSLDGVIFTSLFFSWSGFETLEIDDISS